MKVKSKKAITSAFRNGIMKYVILNKPTHKFKSEYKKCRIYLLNTHTVCERLLKRFEDLQFQQTAEKLEYALSKAIANML